jgi:hypothetical protein
MNNKIVDKGKMIFGFLHVHPNGQPPSPADLSHFLEADKKEVLQGVIAQDHFLLFGKTKETIGNVTKMKSKENEWILPIYKTRIKLFPQKCPLLIFSTLGQQGT